MDWRYSAHGQFSWLLLKVVMTLVGAGGLALITNYLGGINSKMSEISDHASQQDKDMAVYQQRLSTLQDEVNRKRDSDRSEFNQIVATLQKVSDASNHNTDAIVYLSKQWDGMQSKSARK